MHELKIGEQDLLSFVKPDSFIGAVAYFLIFVVAAMVLSRALRVAVHAELTRKGHIDRTTISFLQQLGTVLIWVIVLILYAHLIPVLRSMGTALLAGASVASVVIGLAAQSTLGNLVAGVSITIYRPFRLGDTLQVAAPTGTDIGGGRTHFARLYHLAGARRTLDRSAQQHRRQSGDDQSQFDIRAGTDRHYYSSQPRCRRGSGAAVGAACCRGKRRREKPLPAVS